MESDGAAGIGARHPSTGGRRLSGGRHLSAGGRGGRGGRGGAVGERVQSWLRKRGVVPRIARPGIESGERLGRHRWKIERSIAWLFGYRRLTVRYERKGSHFFAFLGLAAALTCYKKPAKLTT